jgi:hypothetical protein
MYGGIPAEHASTNAAVSGTSGLYLAWQGRPALAYYSSTSGGRTAAASDEIPGMRQLPYLMPVSDPYDSLSPHHRWGPYRFTVAGLAKRLGVPSVHKLGLALNGSGRVGEVRVSWRGGGVSLSGRAFAARLDLPSDWFAIRDSAIRSAPLRPTVSGGAVPAAPSSSADWPLTRRGYTVVLESVPVSSGLAAAKADASRARSYGLDAGVLRSADFANLHPGYYVVFSGVYSNAAAATSGARAAAAHFAAAYPRLVAG